MSYTIVTDPASSYTVILPKPKYRLDHPVYNLFLISKKVRFLDQSNKKSITFNFENISISDTYFHPCIVWPVNIHTICTLMRHVASVHCVRCYIQKLHKNHLALADTETCSVLQKIFCISPRISAVKRFCLNIYCSYGRCHIDTTKAQCCIFGPDFLM